MALDPSALLTQVETAIEALLTGGASSYSIGARSVTTLDLPNLFEQRRMLLNEVQRQSGGAIRLARITRPSR
jgi:hypothetical protein